MIKIILMINKSKYSSWWSTDSCSRGQTANLTCMTTSRTRKRSAPLKRGGGLAQLAHCCTIFLCYLGGEIFHQVGQLTITSLWSWSDIIINTILWSYIITNTLWRSQITWARTRVPGLRRLGPARPHRTRRGFVQDVVCIQRSFNICGNRECIHIKYLSRKCGCGTYSFKIYSKWAIDEQMEIKMWLSITGYVRLFC